jgi:hypothetical protein
VEVRQQSTVTQFDRQIPNPEAVLVTRVRDATIASSSPERAIQLAALLNPGQYFTDPEYNLRIEVVGRVGTNPLAYRIRVQWNQPVPDPAPPGTAKFDLWITPWDTNYWETIDIWVDSLRNDRGTFEFHEPGNPTSPIRNGDRPWVGHRNTIIARVRNSGPNAISNVAVAFYENYPPGVGDNGEWRLIRTVTVPSIAPGAATLVQCPDWVPTGDGHTCLMARIEPFSQGSSDREGNYDNNAAQENIATFDSAGGSSHQPVVLKAQVRNPFSVWRRVDMYVRGLPRGWHASVEPAWAWLPPYGTKPLTAVLSTDKGTRAEEGETEALAEAKSEGWTDFADRYMPIGGILAAVKATTHVDCTANIDVGSEGELYVAGYLDPPLANVPITVEVVGPTGEDEQFFLTTGADGCYDLNQLPGGSPQLGGRGTYSVQVFVTAGGEAAETETDVKHVAVK